MVIGISLFILNCDTDNIISNNDSGPNGSYLTRGDNLAQIESSPPSGTRYGTGNRSIAATGGEYLQNEYWVDNIYSSNYKIDVFDKVLVFYVTPEYIYVNYPVNVTYKHVTSGWISLSSSGYITTDSLKTDTSGSCTIETNEVSNLGGNPGNA